MNRRGQTRIKYWLHFATNLHLNQVCLLLYCLWVRPSLLNFLEHVGMIISRRPILLFLI